MRLSGSRGYAKPAPAPTMPAGLVELMEGLAKDVLKNNPENIYEFCAGHMQKLLEIRDGPTSVKKPLSLEQKIAQAQLKIRQRMRDRQNLHNKNMLEHSSETQDRIETPTHNLDSTIQPVVHGELGVANEVEIFHEPDLALMSEDTTTKEVSQVKDKGKKDVAETKILDEKEPVENAQGDVIDNTSSDDVKQVSEIIAVDKPQIDVIDVEMIQKVEIKESTEQAEEVKENSSDDPKGVSDVENIVATENEIKEDMTQNLESKESTEKVNGDVRDNVLQCKDAAIDHTENVPQNKEHGKNQFIESEAIVTNIVSNLELLEEQSITLEQQPLEKEMIKHESVEVTSIQPLTNNSVTKLPDIGDNVTEEAEDVIEDKVIQKEELIDTKHDDILIGKNNIHIEPKEPTTHSNDGAKAEENPEALLPISEKSDESAAEEVTHNEPTPHQTETLLDGSQVEPSQNTETPDNKANLEVSVNGSKSEDQVITVRIIDKVNPKIDKDSKNDENLDGHDVHKIETNNISGVEKQIIDTDNKLPEQERAYSGEFELKQNDVIEDDTVNKNNKIFVNDDPTESTAVSGMDLETAAITIQKVFRTFLFSKSRASTLDDTVNENSLDEDIEKKDEPEYVLTSANLNKERRTLGITRMDTVLQTVNEEKSLSLSDDSSLSSAATTIQAHVRGFLVRNRLASNKTASSSSLVNSDGPSTLSLDGDGNEPKKTILNIHIVPERGQFMSRDESLLTSIDLPLDNSPPSSINLHPLGYDKSERRKLKREDAVQSISPPSNNSGKLSEEVDSVKDVLNDSVDLKQERGSISEDGQDKDTNNIKLENRSLSEGGHDKSQDEDTVRQENEYSSVNGHYKPQDADTESCDTTLTISSTAETVVDAETYNTTEVLSSPEHNLEADNKGREVVNHSSSDEMDVVTPFPTIPEKAADIESDEKPKLVHSGEFHDMVVVQTQVKRTESSVVREFKNVLVYFLLWDKT